MLTLHLLSPLIPSKNLSTDSNLRSTSRSCPMPDSVRSSSRMERLVADWTRCWYANSAIGNQFIQSIDDDLRESKVLFDLLVDPFSLSSVWGWYAVEVAVLIPIIYEFSHDFRCELRPLSDSVFSGSPWSFQTLSLKRRVRLLRDWRRCWHGMHIFENRSTTTRIES